MPYIGKQLSNGNYLKLDDISSSFNGSTTTFSLTNGGSAYYPGSELSILVSVGGVIQEPESAYQINNDEITFANAPTAQDSFFCVVLGDAIGINVPGNNTVNGAQMAKPFNYDGGLLYLNDTDNRVGINSTSPSVALDVVGDLNVSGNISGIGGTLGGTLVGNVYASSGISTFNDLLVNGDLTVQGDTTTLNTTLRNVELLRVAANSNTAAGIVTQTGTGDILNLYDGATEVFSVADGGNITATGSLNLGNTLYWDGDSTTTIDNAGISSTFRFKTGGTTVMDITATKNVQLKDDRQLLIGASNDLTIYHSSSANKSYITSATHDVIHSFNVGKPWTLQTTAADKRVHCPTTKSVELYWNGNKKFETSGSGTITTGISTVTGTIDANGGADIVGGLTVDQVNATGISTFGGYISLAQKIIHTGDADTSIEFANAGNIIKFETQGSERLQIDANGNIQVSTTTDTGAHYIKINSNRSTHEDHLGGVHGVWNGNTVGAINILAGADTTNKDDGHLQFITYAGGTAYERLRINSSGAVGINSTSPTSNYKLDVNGDLTLGEWKGTDNTYLDQKQDGDLHIINSGRTANGASNTPGCAGVGINRYNNISGGTSLFRDFCVYNGKNSKVLYVDGSTSSVGIGTDSPDLDLHVKDASGQCGVWVEGNDGGAGAYILLKNNSTASNPKTYVGGVDAGGQGTSQVEFHNLDNGTNEGALSLHTRPASGSMQERLRFTSGVVASFGNSTPPAWANDTGYYNIQLGKTGYLRADTDSTNTFMTIGQNAYKDSGGWKYAVTAGASSIFQQGGTIVFETAASGSAGNALSLTKKLQITSGGNVNIGGNYTQTTYTMRVTGSFAATTKSFVIDHPTKENHKLRYACLEGPENSVYVRGRSSDSVIELPDYWVGLVHDDSITVNVTPIGNKKVWVESINNNSVTIGSDDSTEYFYTVFAERKDVEKLEVEVEN